jgi:serine/threonine protein kinase
MFHSPKPSSTLDCNDLSPNHNDGNNGNGNSSSSSSSSNNNNNNNRVGGDGTVGGCSTENGEFSSPNAVNQLGFAIEAGQRAADRLQYFETRSRLSRHDNDAGGDDNDERDIMLRLHWEDILVEELLGVGGFCCVCLVRCKKLDRELQQIRHPLRKQSGSSGDEGVASAANHSDDEMTMLSSEYSVELSCDEEDESDDDGGHAHTSTRQGQQPPKYYALKCLSNRTMATPSMFLAGACDLVGEAFYLMRLKHPNIIRIYAVTAGSTLDAFLKPGGYFLVVEAFRSILGDELSRWIRMSSTAGLQRGDGGDDDDDDGEVVPSLQARLKSCVDVARAMAYLHSKHVVFRDLKARNCGIDEHGKVKLLDFGLARELNETGRYPGIAGSMRSLAPETILGRFCCKASDVYAFGMLLWELCTLRVPFEGLSRPSEFKDLVAIGGARPSLDGLEPSIAAVIDSCWNGDLLKRPTFEEILGYLGDATKGSESCGAISAPDDKVSSQSSRMDDT